MIRGPLMTPLLDVIAQRDVAFSRAAARKNRRVAGVEQRLHLRFFVRPGVDVAMRVDEPGDRRQAASVDRRAGGRGGAPAAADTIRPPRTTIDPASMHRAVGDDDPRVGDGEVLSGDARRTPSGQNNATAQGSSSHFVLRRSSQLRLGGRGAGTETRRGPRS